jgi:hypothetical protein
MQMKVELKATGPLFRAGGPNLDREINGAIKELVQMGEERLDETLRPRPAGVFLSAQYSGWKILGSTTVEKQSKGHYRRSVSTEFGHLNALISDGGVVYGPWLEGISTRNQTTRFKGYASFRRTGDWLNGKARGVLKAYVDRFVRRMNA